jgi:hypothetical protein
MSFHIHVQKNIHIHDFWPIISWMSLRNRFAPYTHEMRMHSAIAISRTDQLAAYLSTSWSQYIPLWNRWREKGELKELLLKFLCII